MSSLAHRIEIHRHGGPEVLEWRECTLPAVPAPGMVRMRNTAVGLNFIDIYYRTGAYPGALNGGIGMECAGVIEAVGDGVTGFAPGMRVGTLGPALGAYATAWDVPAAQVLPIPDGVSDQTAAATLLKGCTAEFLVERCAKVQPGWPVLVHAAAGGVGLLLVQWLKHIGAVVIGTAGSAAKAQAARQAGADHVLDAGSGAIAATVRDLTGGAGVAVSFDGVGAATWPTSLAATRRRGLIVSFGSASGPVEGVALASLVAAGSVFVTRPTLFDYYRDPVEAKAGAARVFDLLRRGVLGVTIGQTYPLTEAARAHADLAARQTTGSTILIP